MMLLSVVAVAGALLLASAGFGHARHGYRLRAALAAQRLFPRRLHRAVATLVTVLEVAVGGSVLVAMTGLDVPARWVPPAAQAAMFAGFAGYLSAVRRRRPSAPCGCFGTDGPVTWLLVGRAGVLAAGAAGAAVAVAAGARPTTSPPAFAAAALIAMASWLVPVLTTPAGTPAR